jgi:hypothetical protein
MKEFLLGCRAHPGARVSTVPGRKGGFRYLVDGGFGEAASAKAGTRPLVTMAARKLTMNNASQNASRTEGAVSGGGGWPDDRDRWDAESSRQV